MYSSRFWSWVCLPSHSIFPRPASLFSWWRAIFAAVGLWYGATCLIAEWNYSTGLSLVGEDFEAGHARLVFATRLFPFDWRYRFGPMQADVLFNRAGLQALADAREVRSGSPHLPMLAAYETMIEQQERAFNPAAFASKRL